MTDKNTIVRRVIDEVWNKGDLKLVDECFTNDYVNKDPMGNVKGHDGLKDLVKKFRTAFPDLRLNLEDVITTGDRAVLRWTYNGTQTGPFEGISPTGRHASGPGISILRFSGDRIQESHVVWDALGLMQQVGVVTLPGKAARSAL